MSSISRLPNSQLGTKRDTDTTMQRIVILGIPGAGKSTFARRLGEKLDLPVYHLDRYFWSPGWKASTQERFETTLRELLDREQWILDGNYRRTIPLRLARADTVIHLDVPRRTALRRVLKRIATYRDGGRPDMADGCPERWFDRDFLGYIWRYHRDIHPEVLDHVAEFEKRSKGTVVRLRGDRDIERWLHEGMS
jgi:adenylate kinase family enzyme